MEGLYSRFYGIIVWDSSYAEHLLKQNIIGIIKVYVRKLFKLKNDGKKECLCLLSICTAIK